MMMEEKCVLAVLFFLELALNVECFFFSQLQYGGSIHKERNFRSYAESSNSNIPNDIERVLSKEYATFFSPMFKSYYSNSVEFIDPLNTLVGIEKYQNNVDMLAGRNSFGSFLFKDASISLHNVKRLDNNKLQTRWTLQVTVKSIPWQPRPRFSGVSIYTLNDEGIIIRQEDYWDSINLINGKYSKVSITEAIGDFLGQLQKESGAEMSAPELPHELLRRGKFYDVRRYPATVCIQTNYDKRPEGYDRLASYIGGSNSANKRIDYLSPTIMQITGSSNNKGEGGDRKKVMRWPVLFAFPGSSSPTNANNVLPEPTIPRISFVECPEMVVAVSRFEMAATEPVVKGYTLRLQQDLASDGIAVKTAGGDKDSAQVLTVAQYDALFSLNKRRNEVWLELADGHPWSRDV